MDNLLNEEEPVSIKKNKFALWGFVLLIVTVILLTRYYDFYPQEGDLLYDFLLNSFILNFLHYISPISPILLLASLILSIIGLEKAKVCKSGRALSIVSIITGIILLIIYLGMYTLAALIV